MKASTILVFFALLGFGVCLSIPAEDVPETAYDESETLPYESAALVSIVVPLEAPRTTSTQLMSLPSELVGPSLLTLAGFRDTDAHRSFNARISLALLCTLLC